MISCSFVNSVAQTKLFSHDVADILNWNRYSANIMPFVTYLSVLKSEFDKFRRIAVRVSSDGQWWINKFCLLVNRPISRWRHCSSSFMSSLSNVTMPSCSLQTHKRWRVSTRPHLLICRWCSNSSSRVSGTP